MKVSPFLRFTISIFVVFSLLIGWAAPGLAAQVSGAIYTTDVGCSNVNINIFADKQAVYLNGGPTHPGAAGLPDGDYYIKVTEPDGTPLGTSVGSAAPTPVHVTDGSFDQCYQLWTILIKASNGTQGYDDTTNGGGVYKVWASQDMTFANDNSKTDNFKVLPQMNPGLLHVFKFYDANTNGLDDDGIPIYGWKIHLQDSIDYIRYTPVSITLEPDDYTITEYYPQENNWVSTTPNPVFINLLPGAEETVKFGNVCLGKGGGKTLGFWSNKNGKAMIGDDDLAMLADLNLRDGTGNDFDPTVYDQLRAWLLGGKAVNMAYMLSVQLAAMELNVFNGLVDGNAMIYAPGTQSANALGFATVNALMAEANSELGLHGYTPSGSPDRQYQELLKDVLDRANNNYNFVQPQPCPFTFNDDTLMSGTIVTGAQYPTTLRPIYLPALHK